MRWPASFQDSGGGVIMGKYMDMEKAGAADSAKRKAKAAEKTARLKRKVAESDKKRAMAKPKAKAKAAPPKASSAGSMRGAGKKAFKKELGL
jgi:hypothetical protein